MEKRSLKWTLIISLLIHGGLVIFAFFAPKLITPPKKIIEVAYLNDEELKKAMAQFEDKQQRQIVEQSEKSVNNEVPENAKFLSQNNQTVKKQTQAAQKGEFKNTAAKTPGFGTGGKPKLDLNNLKPTFDAQKTFERKMTQEKMIEETLDKEAFKVAKEKAQAPPKPAETTGNNGAQASQTQDYLKDVETNMETMLSTKEFVYYSFYARIRKQLNQHWSGKVRDKLTKLFREGRTIASEQDKITKLLITLNQAGQLVKVQVLSNSGIRDLDEAAIEAFRAAAPFPNPPKGILETDGTIKIRWDFILEA